MIDVLEKRCLGPCGRTLPATPEHFHRKEGGLCTWCKKCRNNKLAKRDANPTQPISNNGIVESVNVETIESDVPVKRCIGPCGKLFKATSENFYPSREGILRNMCKACKNLQTKNRNHQYHERGEAHSMLTDVTGNTELPYMTTATLAKRTGQTASTIKYAIHSGRLRAFKESNKRHPGGEWYINREDAEQYIANMAMDGHNQTVMQDLQETETIPVQEIETTIIHRCGSCGTTRGNIVGDIDINTGGKYGLLCIKCYPLVRDFGGDLDRIRKVLDYVDRTRGHTV